jgi:hypothetical protein
MLLEESLKIYLSPKERDKNNTNTENEKEKEN